MANHRAEEVFLERKIIRNGKSRGHTVILLRPSALGEWLSHNTYIVDPGNAQRVDDGGKDPKRDRFVATQENALLCDLCLRRRQDRKSTRLNSSHTVISYAVFCLKK